MYIGMYGLTKYYRFVLQIYIIVIQKNAGLLSELFIVSFLWCIQNGEK